MGLLDDAIREHLELKRRRGADPGEVERQEHEVLGDTPRAEFVDPSDEAAQAEPAAAGEPEIEPEAPAAEPEDHEPFDVEAFDEPEPEPEATPPPPPPPAGEAWLEEDEPEAAPAEEPPAEGESEDVLQDTPEFLQETPEHDRLWFEQRPPRDFDWDK
jgi:hypothetical protein